jgi:Mg-chelatase subunit ChlD
VAERLGNRAHLAAPVKFFGVETTGQRFAFVVDKSGSMEGRRWVACLRQLEAALWSLPDSGQFAVVLFNESALTSGNNDWQRADVATIEKELAWVKKMFPGGGTLPTPAFEHVFRMPSPPDVIFFLTDGDLGGFGPEQLAQLRGAAHTVVNAIAMESPGMAEALKALADESGGQFAAIADASVEAAK